MAEVGIDGIAKLLMSRYEASELLDFCRPIGRSARLLVMGPCAPNISLRAPPAISLTHPLSPRGSDA